MKNIVRKLLVVILVCLLSAGGISEPVMASNAGTTMVSAQKKVWDIINTYADPDYFLEDIYHYRTGLTGKKEMSDSQYETLHQTALNATKNCSTQYEKIKAVTEYVANRVYYDYKYLYDKSNMTYVKPYDVYKYKRATCSGYTALTTTLLVSIGIPCMELYTNSHTYNAAYDSTARKWIVVDTTWCSKNRYGYSGDREEWSKNKANFAWFDKTPEELGKDSSHCVYWVDGLTDKKYNSAYYRLCTGHDSFYDSVAGWSNTGNWYLNVAGARKSNLKAVGSFAGLKVRNVQCDPRRYGSVQNDKTIKTVDLSETGIPVIEGGAFKSCEALTKVIFPVSLTEIGASAFACCWKLKEVDMSKTKVKNIGYYAFPNTVVIYGKSGSYAEKWARKNGNAFKEKESQSQEPQSKDLSACKITLAGKTCFYTGKAVKPSVTVKNGSKTLKKGTDYTISYANNTKVGKATVTVKGKGKYTGSRKVNFQIVKNMCVVKAASAGFDSVKVSWERIPGVTGYKIYRADGKNGRYKCIKTIKSEKTTSYKDGKLITGKTYRYQVKPYIGKEEGSAAKAVSAEPVPLKVTFSSAENSASKTTTLVWKKVSGASGYEIYRATSRNGNYRKVAAAKNGNITSCKDTKLKKGKTYYYKVRAYRTVKGKKVYGAYSEIKRVKIKK